MRDRFDFWQAAVAEGRRWFLGVADHAGRLLTVVALVVGVPAGLALRGLGWWAVLVGVGILVLLVLGEGAFRVWRDTDTELTAHLGWELDTEQMEDVRGLFAVLVRVGGGLARREPLPEDEVAEWTEEAGTLVADAFGYSRVVLFEEVGDRAPSPREAIEQRVAYLAAQVEDLDELQLRPHFDPAAWSQRWSIEVEESKEGGD